METTLDLAKAASPEVFGRECAGCRCDLDWIHFRRDSSQRDGHAILCHDCESAPRLSTSEHTARLKERNFNLESVRKQRVEDQDEYKNDEARVGRAMNHQTFLSVLRTLVPSLYIVPGRIVGQLAIFQTAASPQSSWGGRDFKYLMYTDTGILPEFSQYEFDKVRDIRIREKRRGWRTILLRLIKANLLDEKTCNQVFGRPECQAATIWHKELWKHRNRAIASQD